MASTPDDPLALVVFVVLVLACFAAFFLTQRLKHTPTAIQEFHLTPRFSPHPKGHIKLESISFKPARADRVTVAIIDSRGDVVATLVRNHALARYKQFSLRWNGRRGLARHFRHESTPAGRSILVPVNTGRLAPPGEYRVKVSLHTRSAPVLSPRSFTLVAG